MTLTELQVRCSMNHVTYLPSGVSLFWSVSVCLLADVYVCVCVDQVYGCAYLLGCPPVVTGSGLAGRAAARSCGAFAATSRRP